MSANQNPYPNRREFLTGLGTAPIAISAPNIVLAVAPIEMSADQKRTFVWATYGLWQDAPAALPEPSPALEQVQRLTFDFYRAWGMDDPCKPENHLTNFYVLRWAEQRGLAV